MLDIANMLRSRGLKNTPHRHAIIQTIDKHGHVDIDTLFNDLTNDIKIPLGTLYRSISELQESGIVKTVVVNGLKTMFEIEKKEHSHFICSCCGMVIDVDYEIEKERLQTAFFEHTVNSAQLVIYGVCSSCKNSASNF